MEPDVARDRPFAALVVMLRLPVLTGTDQRAGWLAAHAGYVPAPAHEALDHLERHLRLLFGR